MRLSHTHFTVLSILDYFCIISGKPNDIKVFGNKKTKDMIAKIGYGHLCLREVNINFHNTCNYINKCT